MHTHACRSRGDAHGKRKGCCSNAVRHANCAVYQSKNKTCTKEIVKLWLYILRIKPETGFIKPQGSYCYYYRKYKCAPYQPDKILFRRLLRFNQYRSNLVQFFYFVGKISV